MQSTPIGWLFFAQSNPLFDRKDVTSVRLLPLKGGGSRSEATLRGIGAPISAMKTIVIV
jgi:hypothetical protein